MLKGLLTALPNLAPRVVLRLGYTTSQVDTVQKIPIPSDVPDNDPAGTEDETGDEDEAAAGDGASGGDSGTGAAVAGSSAPTSSQPTGASDSADGALADTALASGLPKLFSIPGMLLLGGIALATVAGSYLRRLGAAALGGGASCSHGLDSGLPDLRKA